MQLHIGFSYPRHFKLGAWLISKWTNRPYSHVYIRYVDNQGRNLVFHAAKGLVHLVTFNNFVSANKVIKEHSVEFSETEYQMFRDYYYSKLGQDYSYKALLIIPMRDLGILKVTKNSGGYICSELTGEMLSLIKGIKFNKPWHELKPSDIEEALIKKS